ncbi:MAG TPA: serine hydrolase [Anaerolineales bacterium]|nr:serine hydrolase [Anaerolineales bacterium]
MTLNEKDPRSRNHWPTLGWEEGSPQAHGMNDKLLWSADETIRRDLPNVYSLLVVRNSTIVFEQYYQGHAATSLFDIRSATKSFVSALIGIAVKEKQIPNLDQKILSYFPEHQAADMDPRKAAITIRNLLMMKSGLAWDEERDFAELYSSEDWVEYIFKVPMRADPGSVFDYNSGASHILSEVIHRATGMTALEYAQQRLFLPLGIGYHHWAFDPMGISLGYAGLSLTVRDFAKLGLLYASHGIWDGGEILMPEYIRDSTTAWSSGGFPEEAEYGYHWWVLPSEPHPAYFAAGYGGQYLWIVPDLDLIVVTTAKFDLPPWLTQEHRFLITDFVLASALSDEP